MCILFFFVLPSLSFFFVLSLRRVTLQPEWFRVVASIAGIVLLSSIVYNRHREYYRFRTIVEEDGENSDKRNFERKQFILFTSTLIAYASILIAIGKK